MIDTLAGVQTLDPLALYDSGQLSDYELMAANPVFWSQLSDLKIQHPIKGAIPFDFYPYQVAYLADGASRRLIVKARQTGISQVCGLEAAHIALFQPGSTVLFISRKEDLAANLIRYVKDILRSVPLEQIGGKLVVDNALEIGFPNGSRIKSESASEGTGRGFAGTALYMDEAAWMQFAQTMYQSALPMTSHGGRVTVLSTPNGRTGVGGFFYLLWSSKMGEGYKRYRIPWYRCPPYNPHGHAIVDPVESKRMGMQHTWYISMRPAFTEVQWATEYDCDFILSGDAYFRDTFIDIMAQDWGGFKEPVMGRRYLKAWDIGRHSDPTVCLVADITDFDEDKGVPAEIVHFERRLQLPYQGITELIHTVHDRYPGWTYVESNGAGDAVVDSLDRRDIQGYFMTAIKKRQALDAFKLLMERRLIKCGIDELLDECRIYTEDDDDIVQDCVMTAAILARQLVTPGPKGGWMIGSKVSS